MVRIKQRDIDKKRVLARAALKGMPVIKGQRKEQEEQVGDAPFNKKEAGGFANALAAAKGEVPSIRTYRTDVADAVKHKGETLASIALKEKIHQRNKKGGRREVKKGKGLIIAGITVIILSAAGGAALYANMLPETIRFPSLASLFPKKTAPIGKGGFSPTESMPTIIPVNGELRINTDNGLSSAQLAETLTKTITPGNINNIYLYESNAFVNAEGDTVTEYTPISAKTFLKLLNVTPPASFLFGIGDEFMLGIHGDASGKAAPFLIFSIASYPQAFAGMLAWEETMRSDLAPIFGSPQGNSGTFFDAIVNKNDARVRTDKNGIVRFIYSFVDKKTLLITTSQETFNAIASLLKQR